MKKRVISFNLKRRKKKGKLKSKNLLVVFVEIERKKSRNYLVYTNSVSSLLDFEDHK